MKEQQGDNFLLLVPGHEGASIELSYSGSYRLKDSSLRDGSIIFHSPVLIPLFAFKTRESVRGGSLVYPQAVSYIRHDKTMILQALEVPFQNATVRIADYTIPVVSKKTVIDLSAEQYRAFLKEGVQLCDDDYLIIPETAAFSVQTVNEKLRRYETYAYLSVKDVLDADVGIDRLIDDINSGRFRVTQRRRTGRLLDILRSATGAEEETIMANLYRDDSDFFYLVQNDLFHEDLLPYMNRSEVAAELSQAPFETLRSAFTDQLTAKKYRRFVSKRKYEDISSAPAVSPQRAEESAGRASSGELFSFIIGRFRKKRQRMLYLEAETCNLNRFTEVDSGAAAPARVEPPYMNTSGLLRVLKVKSRYVFILVREFMLTLQIYLEESRGLFKEYFFRNVAPGILVIDDAARVPERVILAGVNRERSLVEGFAQRIEKQL